FFFFQAEDGIRDKLVTGVQTCALPICARARALRRTRRHGRRRSSAARNALVPVRLLAAESRERLQVVVRSDRQSAPDGRDRRRRSEERRVGKESRSGGAGEVYNRRTSE